MSEEWQKQPESKFTQLLLNLCFGLDNIDVMPPEAYEIQSFVKSKSSP